MQAGATPLASDELLLMDVGARTHFYSADIARTVSINGKPSRRHLAIWQAVCDAQDFAFSLLKPGVVLTEYEKQMEDLLVQLALKNQQIKAQETKK